MGWLSDIWQETKKLVPKVWETTKTVAKVALTVPLVVAGAVIFIPTVLVAAPFYFVSWPTACAILVGGLLLISPFGALAHVIWD